LAGLPSRLKYFNFNEIVIKAVSIMLVPHE
jgi:hypothetical protein